jgi:uncharacterized protein YggE
MKVRAFAILLAIVVIGVPARAQSGGTFDDRPKITVTGEAVVNVKPDKIVISLGIETSDADVGAAKLKNNEIMQKAVQALKGLGITEKDVQTDYLSIQPRWRSESIRDTFLGYFVRNSLIVTITDVAKVEDLVTRVLQSGVNYIHGIDFQTTELKKYREQARELALLAAREKAEKMAAVLGQRIAAPIQINENYMGSPSWYMSSWNSWGRSMGMSASNTQVSVGLESAGDITSTIALGKLAVRANVTVIFELRRQPGPDN